MSYSESYYKIRESIETTWPQWKIDYCNNHVLTSTHARKLERKPDMIKIFISQPMGGRTDEEILLEKAAIIKELQVCYTGQRFEILDSFIEDAPSVKNKSLFYLGKSIEILSQADMAVFSIDWENYRGCVIEYECCKAYNIPTIYQNYPLLFDKNQII